MTLEEMIGQFKAYTEYPNQDTFVISNQECKDILKYLTEQKSFIEWVASEVVSEYWEFNNEGEVGFYYTNQVSDLYFESEEIAKRAIESIGEDRIIKYYFRR